MGAPCLPVRTAQLVTLYSIEPLPRRQPLSNPSLNADVSRHERACTGSEETVGTNVRRVQMRRLERNV